MTDLKNSPVTRRTTVTWKGRRIVITLRADDEIELRLERLSESFRVPILDVFRTAERNSGPHIPARKK